MLFGPSGIGFDEVLLFTGLALIAVGFWWLPVLQLRAGALFAPGMAFVWIALPPRAPFVRRPLDRRRRERV